MEALYNTCTTVFSREYLNDAQEWTDGLTSLILSLYYATLCSLIIAYTVNVHFIKITVQYHTNLCKYEKRKKKKKKKPKTKKRVVCWDIED